MRPQTKKLTVQIGTKRVLKVRGRVPMIIINTHRVEQKPMRFILMTLLMLATGQ